MNVIPCYSQTKERNLLPEQSGGVMISYEPFWKTLQAREVTTYDLIYKQGMSANTIHRLRCGKNISTKTLNELCEILRCGVSDILIYEEDEDKET